MADSRTKNTARNIEAGLLNRAVSILLPFLNRTVILRTLGAAFTGLTGLFSSILSVLNVAELGFHTAIVYSLYKPMAERDEEEICRLASLFRRIYTVMGLGVLGAGLAVMPFLRHLIKGSYPDGINLYALYLLNLVNSAVSYFLFAYKECLLIADQRQDIADKIRTVVSILRYSLQLAVILIAKNYYLYLVAAIIGTLASNLAIQSAAKKRYPFFRQVRGPLRLPPALRRQVQGLIVNRICDTCRNSFDSLIISGFIGLTAAAVYDNYYYIYSAVYGVMLVICNSMGASVGSSLLQKPPDRNYQDMRTLSLVFAWISGWCTACLLCLYQPFMELWAGKELLLPERDMVLFCVYFYVINMNNIRNQYISGSGLWWQLRRSSLTEAAANLLLNIFLGKLFGMTGVICATILTIFVFNYLQRNKILFSCCFSQCSLSEFYGEQLYYGAAVAFSAVITYSVCKTLPFCGFRLLAARGAVCILLPNALLFAGFLAAPQFHNARALVSRVLKQTH